MGISMNTHKQAPHKDSKHGTSLNVFKGLKTELRLSDILM